MALINCKDCGREISKKAVACPSCGAVPKKETTLVTWIVALIFGYFVFSLLYEPISPRSPANNSKDLMKTESQNNALNEVSKEEMLKKIVVDDFAWNKGGFGSIMMANFKITNNNNKAIKDVGIKCISSANSGTVIDANTKTLYEVIPAKRTFNVRDFNMGFIHSQAVTSSCMVIDFKDM